MKMTRRTFMQTTAAVATVGLKDRVFAQDHATWRPQDAVVLKPTSNRVEIAANAKKRGATLPLDFIGLSWESAQLADPTFFSASNKRLVEQFRALGPRGNLRFGGCLAEFTNWWDPAVTPNKPAMTPEMAAGQSRFEWIMVTPSVSKNKYAVITPESLKQLRGFLDATGWTTLYGLNLGCGGAERASREAACAVRELGPRLLGFQVGNEADHFMDWKRPKTWNFDSFWAEYMSFVMAVRQHSPGAPFAGPDAANKTDWVKWYGERAGKDAVALSSHYYRMGPADAPGINSEHMLAPHPLLQPRIDTVMAASRSTGVPYRMTEVNSCSHGGMKGVSDAFASSLWIADYMLQVGQAGFSGVNVHGGGVEGVYSPLVGDLQRGYTARPLTFGMRFANEFAGATFAECGGARSGNNVTAYAAEKAGKMLVAVINKSDRAVEMNWSGVKPVKGTARVLTAPSLNSRTDVMFAPKHTEELKVLQPYTAVLTEAHT